MKMMNWGGILIPLPMDLKNHVHIDSSCPSLKSPSTLKIYIYILRQKKNYENSNISPCKNIIFKISYFKNPCIKIDLLFPRGQNPLSYYTL
jgi:hypothetical protein